MTWRLRAVLSAGIHTLDHILLPHNVTQDFSSQPLDGSIALATSSHASHLQKPDDGPRVF